MPQDTQSILPQFLNLDTSLDKLNPDESPFLKGVGKDINANPELGNGVNNPTGEGQNYSVLTPTRSNKVVPNVLLPDGFNKEVGCFESPTTNELYWMIYNSNKRHCIFVMNGNDNVCTKIIEDPELGFTDDQENYISQHRVTLRVIYNEKRDIVEKILIFTFGFGWQKWINTIAAIKTNGFDAKLYPYWRLQPPHFDRRELLEHAVRPPMVPIGVKSLTPSPDTYGNPNLIVDNTFRFAYDYVYTDGRETTVSPYSLPLITKSDDYSFELSLTPQKAQLTLSAGSPMIETIRIYVQKNDGNWFLYDTINKYANCDENNNIIINYWDRKNPFSAFNYDSVFNTIKYTFGNERQYQIIDQKNFKRVQTDLPIESVALTDLKDELLYCNNKNGYDNFDCDVTSKFKIDAVEGGFGQCPTVLRNISLYAIVIPSNGGVPMPTVKYGNTYIFAGLGFVDNVLVVLQKEVEQCNLYASNGGLVCYLNGTPYYSIGEMYTSDKFLNLTPVGHVLDTSVPDDMSVIGKVIKSKGDFFVIKFNFIVPAGYYTASIGRHDVLVSDDYRNKSTYVVGLIKSQEIYDNAHNVYAPVNYAYTQMMYINCYDKDFDAWDTTNPGNLPNVFYIRPPYIGPFANNLQKWVEGYLYEDPDSLIPMEMVPYGSNKNSSPDLGYNTAVFTDKNGFFFKHVGNQNYLNGQIAVYGNKNCTYYPLESSFAETNTPAQSGFYKNQNIYFSNYNSGVIGSCNRVVLRGRITDKDGVGLSNVSVSIQDGYTALTQVTGRFELVVHNGLKNKRSTQVYVNAATKGFISYDNCGVLGPFVYDEYKLGDCLPCNQGANVPDREINDFINISVQIQGAETLYSVKQNAQYTGSLIGYDLAGRETFVNQINNISVSSFLQRKSTKAMHFEWMLSAGLDLRTSSKTKDISWISFAVTKNITYQKYIQWVGDSITFINPSGVVVEQSGLAAFAKISIDSLLDANIQSNFTLTANYQFVQGDRLRIYDNGKDLLPISKDNLPIDLLIEGTSYNQAAINANVLPPTVNTVLNTASDRKVDPTAIVVLFDERLFQLKNKKGFWIEIYTPSQQVVENIPFYETNNFYPIINGTLALFTGYDNNAKPSYTYPSTGNIDYWDTYIYGRYIKIPLAGGSSFYHLFESPNVGDKWGRDISSGGRENVINQFAKQLWYKSETIRSDVFISNGSKNGLGTFRAINKKSFEGYWRGGIVAVKAMNSIIVFICENDYFITTYNYHFSYANAEGQIVTNLDSGISEPQPKIGIPYGVSYADTGTVVLFDKVIFWYDSKNEGMILCDYKTATDISDITEKDRKYGIKSYVIKKTQFINSWNAMHDISNRFDVVAGIDSVRKNIIVSFRPRRSNTDSPYSFINNRRNIDLKNQETILYNLDSGRWVKTEAYVAEGYGTLRGNESGVELISFASGKPYIHNQSGNNSFLEFFGVQTEPVIMGVFAKNSSITNVFQSLSFDGIKNDFFIDMLYDNENNSFSFIPFNLFKEKEKTSYAGVLRDMVSYLKPDDEKLFRSTLQDGKRVFGSYMVVRIIGKFDSNNNYFQLSSVNCLTAQGHTTKA